MEKAKQYSDSSYGSFLFNFFKGIVEKSSIWNE